MLDTHAAPIALAAALLLTPGCGDSADARATAVESDVDFLDTIVQHHEVAIMMADTELERGESPRVQRVARSVKFVQQDEIAWLIAARERLTGSGRPGTETPFVDADIELLQTATGAQLDRLFLVHMIAHHASAIQIAHEAFAKLRVVHVKAIALKILQEEPAEIGMMQDTLADM
jgi:uncharacterized protein (DUF305 family)